MRKQLATLLLLVGIALVASQRCSRESGHPAHSGSLLGIDSAASLSPELAYATAVELQRSGRHVAALSHFRHAVAAHPEVSELHVTLGQALHNAAIQTDTTHGPVRYVVASSYERLALERAALLELRTAVHLASAPADRAHAVFTLSRIQSLLGLQADAMRTIESYPPVDAFSPVVRAHRELLRRALMLEPIPARIGSD